MITDGTRITAVLDWDAAGCGDPLYDVGTALFWRTWLRCFDQLYERCSMRSVTCRGMALAYSRIRWLRALERWPAAPQRVTAVRLTLCPAPGRDLSQARRRTIRVIQVVRQRWPLLSPQPMLRGRLLTTAGTRLNKGLARHRDA